MDPEQTYQEVLQEQQQLGVSAAVAEARAKAARARAEHGSPHPKEPRWWPGAQPHFEGDGAQPEVGAVEEVATSAPAPEPASEAAPAPAPVAEAAAPSAPQPAQAPAAQAPAETPQAPVLEQAAQAAPAQPAAQTQTGQPAPVAPAQAPAQRAPVATVPATSVAEAEPAPERRPAGVTHGTTTGTRLRPEDEVTTEAQFAGQQALYERRKLIDELVGTGVPAGAVAEVDRRGGAGLAILYLLIPLAVIFYLASRGATTTAQPPAPEGPAGGNGAAIELVAEGVAWDTSNLQVPAGQKASITIDNQDSVPHDFAVYESRQAAADTGNALFASPEVAGGSSLDFSFGPLKKGSYFFQCNIHPTTMTGTVVAQ